MRLAIVAIALCALVKPVEAKEPIVFSTVLFDTEEASFWYDEDQAQSLANDRREIKASDLCRVADGHFYPKEYASPGDLNCRTRITNSGKTEAKCRYMNVKAYCRRSQS